MARQNYAFEKRQKELARKQKKEDKLKRKAEQREGGEGEPPVDPLTAPDAEPARLDEEARSPGS